MVASQRTQFRSAGCAERATAIERSSRCCSASTATVGASRRADHEFRGREGGPDPRRYTASNCRRAEASGDAASESLAAASAISCNRGNSQRDVG
jgi:hypothetical protein